MRNVLALLFLFTLLSACSQQAAQIQVTTTPANAGVDAEYGEAFLNASEVQLLFKEDQSVSSFSGLGNEYASFIETTHWLSDRYVAVTIDNGGTMVQRYFYIQDNAIYFIQELTETDALLTLAQLQALPIGQPLMTAPFKIGASVGDWQIIATDETITTPLQTFTNVIVLEKTTANETNTLYLALGFGMIQNEFSVTLDGKEEKIISTLSAIEVD